MAAALDEFFISIGLDASKIESGAQKIDSTMKRATQNIASAVSGTSKDFDTKTKDAARKMETNFKDSLAKVEQNFKTAFNNLTRNVLTPFAAAFGMKKLFSDFTSGAQAVGQSAAQLGVSSEQLQLWGEAAKRAGGSAEGLQGTIKTLQSHMRQLRTTGTSGLTVPLARLGMSVGMLNNGNSFDVLRQLAGRMQGMSAQRANQLGSMLGIDSGTVMLLRQGTKAIDEYMAKAKTLGVYTKSDIEMSMKWRTTMYDLQQIFRSISAVIMRVFVPPLKLIVDFIVNCMAKAKEFKVAIVAVFVALSAAIAPITTAIAALGVAFEDFWIYCKGGKSALEPLWALFGTGEEILKALGDIWKTTKATLLEGWDALSKLVKDVFEGLTPLASTFEPIIKAVGAMFDVLKSVLGLIWDIVKAFTSVDESVDGASEKTSILKSICEGIAPVIELTATAVQKVAEFIKWCIDGVHGFINAIKSFDFSKAFDFHIEWPDIGGWINSVKESIQSISFPDLTAWLPDIGSWVDKAKGFLDDWHMPDFGGWIDTAKEKLASLQLPDFSSWLPDFGGWFSSLQSSFSGITLPDLTAWIPDLTDFKQYIAELFDGFNLPDLTAFKNSLGKLFDGLKFPDFTEFKNSVGKLFDGLRLPDFTEFKNSVGKLFDGLTLPDFTDFKNSVSKLFDGLTLPDFTDFKASVGKLFDGLHLPDFSDFKASVSKLFDGLRLPDFTEFKTSVSNLFSGLRLPDFTDFKQSVLSLFDGLKFPDFTDFKDSVSNLFSGLKFPDFSEFKTSVATLFDGLKFPDFSEFKAAVSGLFDGLKLPDFSELKTTLLGLFDGVKMPDWSGLASKAAQSWQGVKDWIADNAINPLISVDFTAAQAKLKEFAQNLGETLNNGTAVAREKLLDIWNTISEKLSGIWDLIPSISTVLEKWWGALDAWFEKLKDRLIERISEALDWLPDTVKEWMGLKASAQTQNGDASSGALAQALSKSAEGALPPSVVKGGKVNNAKTDVTVRIDHVMVNTQATDAQGVAEAFGGAVNQTLQNNLVYGYNSGVGGTASSYEEYENPGGSW